MWIMDFVKVFLVGGTICVIGQLLLDLTKITNAKILVIFVVSGVLLGAVGLYEPLIEFAGAGAAVPLSGFGYVLNKGVSEGIAESGLLGAFTGGTTAASAGITAALFFGFLVSLVAKTKPK